MTWSQADAANDGSVSTALYGRRSAADGRWSDPSSITTYTTGFDLSFISLADDERAVVVWREADPGSDVRSLKWTRSE